MSASSDLEFVSTKSSLIRKKCIDDFKVIVHKNYVKTKFQKPESNSLHNEKKIMSEVDMKKARFEVYKFSKSKLDYSNKQKSSMELAIQLGAKPPKNKAKNYKELKLDRLKQKTLEKNDNYLKVIQQNATDLKRKSKTNPNKTNFKRKRQGILDVYGKVKRPAKP